MRCFNELRRTPISHSDNAADTRLADLKAWINGIDAVAGAEPVPASGDASFRRYFRLQNNTKSFIAMDAPPGREDCSPFVRIAGYLKSMRLNAPRILEADVEKGFLLLSDLGNEQYLDALRHDALRHEAAPIESGLSSRLYGDAMEALHVMQKGGVKYQSRLPPYNEKLLRLELALFRDWLCGAHLQLSFSDVDEASWKSCCDALVENALIQPQVFVHRDYHSRNLMVTAENNPGILDFQDAVEGPLTYDLVSLLKDCYVRWPTEQVRVWAMQFYEDLPQKIRNTVNKSNFQRYFDLMGVQRHLKAAGIFCRLNHRDGKSAYLADVPRTLGYIVELGRHYEELDFLSRLIDERVLSRWDANKCAQ